MRDDYTPRHRRGDFPWPVNTVLMVVIVVVFIAQEVNRFYIGFDEGRFLALSLKGLANGFFWQVFTFQFLHAGLFHLLMNLLCLYFFGRVVEGRLGKSRFLTLYFLSGVAGGLLQILFSLVLSRLVPDYHGGHVVGASAGIFGIIAAFAALDPEAMMVVYFIPLKAKYFLMIAAAIALFCMITQIDMGVAHAAHFGGMAAGWLYIRWQSGGLPSWRKLIPKRRPRAPIALDPSGEDGPSAPLYDDFISREVDPILDKISTYGIHSLTPEERRILEKARKRMEKR